MSDTENLLDESEVRSFMSALAFVREFSIRLVSVKPGFVTVELPFDERFSGPPTLFPASMVGTAGDVAAVASA
jgi:acyl-coenzyme A thioesterase PaaI-like protein